MVRIPSPVRVMLTLLCMVAVLISGVLAQAGTCCSNCCVVKSRPAAQTLPPCCRAHLAQTAPSAPLSSKACCCFRMPTPTAIVAQPLRLEKDESHLTFTAIDLPVVAAQLITPAEGVAPFKGLHESGIASCALLCRWRN